MSQLAEDLKAAKAYLVEHGRCVKGAGDLGGDGPVCPVVAYHKGAVGDMLKWASTADPNGRFDAWREALVEQFREDLRRDSIVVWNEHPNTTDDDVFAAFDRAIATAEESE